MTEGKRRTKKLTFWSSPQESEAIAEAALLRGLSVADFVRIATLFQIFNLGAAPGDQTWDYFAIYQKLIDIYKDVGDLIIAIAKEEEASPWCDAMIETKSQLLLEKIKILASNTSN
ncbi:MAG: hypothetical protein AAFS12_07090 [Cyanobacteria bacterium J06632_19]